MKSNQSSQKMCHLFLQSNGGKACRCIHTLKKLVKQSFCKDVPANCSFDQFVFNLGFLLQLLAKGAVHDQTARQTRLLHSKPSCYFDKQYKEQKNSWSGCDIINNYSVLLSFLLKSLRCIKALQQVSLWSGLFAIINLISLAVRYSLAAGSDHLQDL